MLKVGQRYAYVDGSGSMGPVRFIAEVTELGTSSVYGDVKVVQILRWSDVGIGHTYRGNRLTDTNYWILLEGQDKPEGT